LAQVQEGNAVKVHYTGKLDDGTVFDSSLGGDPLGFTVGDGLLIPGFENAVVGLQPGEHTVITLEPDQAYGPRREELVVPLGRDQLPEDAEPEIGQQVQLHMADGGVLTAEIVETTEQSITIDANHPLAGKTLLFEIELVEVS